MSALIRWSVPCSRSCCSRSAVGVVWSKHEARSLFIELQGLKAERDALDIEWGQLKLEQSAWATAWPRRTDGAGRAAHGHPATG